MLCAGGVAEVFKRVQVEKYSLPIREGPEMRRTASCGVAVLFRTADSRPCVYARFVRQACRSTIAHAAEY